VRQLAPQLPGPAATAASRQLVRAGGDEAPLGITTGQPLGTRPEIPQQEVDRLASVTDARVRRL